MKKIWRWILCHVLGDHEWTCAAAEGIPATQEQLYGGLAGFYDYAKMYCKHCPKESSRNVKPSAVDGSEGSSKADA